MNNVLIRSDSYIARLTMMVAMLILTENTESPWSYPSCRTSSHGPTIACTLIHCILYNCCTDILEYRYTAMHCNVMQCNATNVTNTAAKQVSLQCNAYCKLKMQNAEQCDDITQNACSAERCIELLLFPINYS